MQLGLFEFEKLLVVLYTLPVQGGMLLAQIHESRGEANLVLGLWALGKDLERFDCPR